MGDWQHCLQLCMHACVGDADGEVVAAATDKAGLKAMLDSIGNLWDEQQYAEDLSLEAFMSKLK